MTGSSFVYVTYIRAPRQKVWDALTRPEFQKIYWFGGHQESDWKTGSSWKMFMPQHGLTDSGEILESDPPNRVVIKWRNEFRPKLKEEGYSRCVMELATEGDLTRLTISHTIEKENAQFIEAVSGGWPRILSSLKSLLETGAAHGDTRTTAQQAHDGT
ncbi:MAG TPA: SRPBCC family protein [Rhizomicrobium sp.]|nr:SRPBCC family protein [Rhizomicrobium sp.]